MRLERNKVTWLDTLTRSSIPPTSQDSPNYPLPGSMPESTTPMNADVLPWWGRVDETRYDAHRLIPDSTAGLVRQVGVSIAFQYTLPFRDLGLEFWHADPQDPRRYEMRLEQRPSRATVWALADLAEDLARTPPRPDDPRLKLLDEVLRRVVEVVASLHRANWRAGYLTPRNILFTRQEPFTLYLPDLGFVAVGSFEQPWLRDDDEFAELCTPRLPVEQHVYDGLARTGPEPDLHLLARLIATVLLAGRPAPAQGVIGWPQAVPGGAYVWRVLRDIPSVRQAPTLVADIWEVLAQVLNGQIRSAEHLHEALQAHPPSDHFRPRQASRWPSSLGLLAASAATLSLLAGGYLWWKRQPPIEPPAPVAIAYTEAAPPLDETAPAALRTLQSPEFAGSLEKKLALLVEAYRPEVRVKSEAERQAREHARWQTMRQLRAEVDRLREGEETPGDAVARVRLTHHLQSLEEVLIHWHKIPAEAGLQTEERECLEELRRVLQPLQGF